MSKDSMFSFDSFLVESFRIDRHIPIHDLGLRESSKEIILLSVDFILFLTVAFFETAPMNGPNWPQRNISTKLLLKMSKS